MSLPLVLILGEDDCDDDVAGCHSDRANDQDRLAANFVHVSYGWHGCEPHDDADDTTCEKRSGVAGKTQALENLFYVSMAWWMGTEISF